jgi:hypothetical protein
MTEELTPLDAQATAIANLLVHGGSPAAFERVCEHHDRPTLAHAARLIRTQLQIIETVMSRKLP